jgi:hypothetical protein
LVQLTSKTRLETGLNLEMLIKAKEFLLNTILV